MQQLPEITGRTAVLLQLAHPVGHVRAPHLFNEALRAAGHDAVMVPLEVHPDDLDRTLAAVRRWENIRGLGITMPHKQAVLERLDELTDAARRSGAVNSVRRESDGRLVGGQFDGVGFVDALAERGFDPEGRHALLVGAGGVGRPIAFELARRGLSAITIVNRTTARARQLAADLRSFHADLEVVVAHGGDDVGATDQSVSELSGHDLVVNATSLGMREDDPLPVAPEVFAPGVVVGEVVMNPAETSFLQVAAQRGCVVVPGQSMLDRQIAATLDFWRFTSADR